MENTENDNPAMSSESPAESGSELRYLLSAYLFDSLSEEGRTEVERQLERSESCRRELDELKATLELVADVLVSETDDSSSYSFEHRRMERVLSAKKKIRLLRIRFPSRRLAAVAAALLLASVTAFVFLANRGLDTLEMAADGKMENRSIFSGGAPTLDGRIGGLAPRHGSASPVSAEPESDKSRSLRRQEKPVYRNAAERSTARPAAGEDAAFDEGEVEEDAGEDLDEAAEEHPQAASKTEQKKRTASSRKMLTERMRKPAAAARPPPPAAPRRPRGQAAAPSTPGRSKNSPSKREGQSAVVDAIGIGGGAAGGYGNRYGKGGLVKEKAKFGAASIEENLKQGVKLPKTSLAQKEGEAADGISSTAGRLNSRERHVQQRKLQPLGKTSLDRRDRTALDLHATLPRPIKEPIIKRKIDAPAAEHGPVNETRDASKVLQEEGRSLSAGRDARKANNGGRKGAAGKALFFEQLGNSNKQNDGSNQWHAQQNYDLNIKNTDEGYFSLGLDSLSRESKSQLRPGPGDARVQTINEQVLNNFAFYKQLDPNLSYDQFDSRALVIPPPALGDEGLGEKGFRARYGVNPFVATCRDHLSTFGMDVDTASWGRARESIRNKKLPPPQTIRVEEFINNFSDERPGNPNAVFSVYTEGGPSPFGDHGLELIQITLKSRELRAGERKDAILTFAVDTSGSMAADGKIDLLKKSIRTLVDKLAPADRVAIIAFATNAYVVLPHTPVRQKAEILGAIESLTPIGGTNVEAGIDLAYRLAGESSHKRAANRVILCSDGVANLGARGPEMILKKIARFASEDRIALYTYAFGSGGRQAVRGDKMLQQLANRGDGRYQYVDSGSAATKIFSVPDELQVLAADAKIQVNFHPDVVSHYRLLGYEKRDIADKDFRNDKIDAGEVGPGSTVTALYEIKRSRPVGSIGRIYLRYKDAVSSTVEEFNYELHPGVLAGGSRDTSDRFRFIASVAEFAELLRGSYYARNGSFGATLQLMSGVSIDFKKRSDWKEAYRSISAAQGLSAVQTLNSIR